MAGETFQLRFANNEDLTVSIDEPINFATVDFQLNQKDKGYGRDVSFNGGETQFEFVKYRNHYLDKLISYNKVYGFESIVELIITTTISPPTIIGELDFATAITDDLEYFRCKVIQASSKQIVKRRKSVKVDLLSDKDIDGNTITALTPANMVMIAKPITENSRWKSNATGYVVASSSGGSGVTKYKNYCAEAYDSSILNTFAPSNTGDGDGTRLITAAGVLNNIKINISSHTLSGKLVNVDNWLGYSGSGDATHYFGYRYGLNFASATEVIFAGTTFDLQYGDEVKTYTKSFTATIPTLPLTHSIWLYHSCYVRHAGGGYSELKLNQSAMNVEIIAETTSVNSVVLSFRLVDVMRQVVKSISGLDIVAPRFDTSGDFYNNRLVSGNFLRKITEVTEVIDDGVNPPVPTIVKKPFLISLEDLEKSLVELNVDWEIDVNGDIFFGIEDDFYTNNLVGTYTNTQFSSFNKSFNPRFQINEFNYGYKKFQSQKENEILNSYDVINGESKWVLQNKNVENKKDISIEWIRDSFLIEESRRKAIELSSSTSSQDDDTLFIIDAENTVEALSYPTDLLLAHYYNGEDEHLLLTSTTTNLSLLPLTVGDKFNITTISNKGNYFIISISDNILELERITDDPTNTIGVATTYSWTYIDSAGVTQTGTPQTITTSLPIHTFISTGISPDGERILTLTRPIAFAITHNIGDLITITTDDNKGKYIVTSVSNTGTFYIKLKRLSDASTLPAATTTYTYSLNTTINPFTSYTDVGFTFTDYPTIIGQDKFANLRYSIKRNIHNYWRKYIATCNLYHRTLTVDNTIYKNNKGFISTYAGLKLKESDSLTTGFYSSTAINDFTPILSPFIYNDVILSNIEYSDYVALQDNLKTNRGYIVVKDNSGNNISLYPMSMKYENLSKELTIKAEEKFTSIFVPSVVTESVTEITSNSFTAKGSISSNGYLPITNKGVVWNITPNPTIGVTIYTQFNVGAGDDPFTCVLNTPSFIMTPNTTYYVRAFATNSYGTGYGDNIVITTGIGDYSPTDYLSTDYSVTI